MGRLVAVGLGCFVVSVIVVNLGFAATMYAANKSN